MNNIIRLAALELQATPNSHAVKIAGIMDRLKNVFRRLTDKEYAESIDKLRDESSSVQNTANLLQKRISELNLAIKEGNVEDYDAALDAVRELTTELSLELSKLEQKAEESNPRKAPISFKKNLIEEVYNREQWDDKKQRKELVVNIEQKIKEWHPDFDVPVKRNINLPLLSFNWFTDKKIAIEDGAKNNIIRQFEQKAPGLGEIVSKSWNEFARRLTVSIINGKLLHYTPEAPDTPGRLKEVKQRPVGEMLAVVKTAYFTVPGIGADFSMVVGLHDISTRISGEPLLIVGWVKDLRKESADFPLVNPKKEGSLHKEAGVNLSAAKQLPDSFWSKFVTMSNRLGAKPEDLAQVIYSESAFDPHATNVQNGHIIAKGLNQLIHSTAKSLGMSEGDWQNYQDASVDKQLEYVEKYFARYGRNWNSATQLYVANFAPKYIKQSKNPNAVLYDSTINPLEYRQNKGLDRNKKGHITVGDLAHSVQGKLPDYILKALKKAQMNQTSSSELGEEEESDSLLKSLFAMGPVEKAVKQATNLPNSQVLISLSSMTEPFATRLSFAKMVSEILTGVIEAETSIHTNGTKIEISCSALGNPFTVAGAIQSLCGCVSEAFYLKNSSDIQYMIVPQCISKYGKLNG